MGEVVWLGRYPIKSMLGEDVTDAVLDESGVVGDRRYALIDEDTGLIASAKNPRKWRALLTMAARYLPADGHVTVTLPGGTVLRGDDPTLDAVLSRFLGRSVRLSHNRPDGATMERLTPEVEASAGQLTRGRLAAGTPGHTFVDFAAVHLLTTATLNALSEAHPTRPANAEYTVDARRFRPNVVVRMFDEQPFVENTWLGRTLSIGADASVRVVAPTPRCAVPTLAHGADLPDDPDILRTAARLNRVPVLDLGALTCVGAYAAVAQGGRLRVGDRVTVA
jgi:uncharacterized protein YcbX